MEEKQRIIFLKGKKVVLRPLNKETDLKNCTKWMNDQEIGRYLGNAYLPKSLEQEEEEWFDDLVKRKDHVYLAIETLKGIYIGNISMAISWKDRNAGLGVCIGEKEYWGKGFGTDVMMLLLEYAFNTLNLRKICLTVFDFNKRAKRVYEKCGFIVEGVSKEHVYQNGKYIDLIEMAVFKKDFLPIWEKYNKN